MDGAAEATTGASGSDSDSATANGGAVRGDSVQGSSSAAVSASDDEDAAARDRVFSWGGGLVSSDISSLASTATMAGSAFSAFLASLAVSVVSGVSAFVAPLDSSGFSVAEAASSNSSTF